MAKDNNLCLMGTAPNTGYALDIDGGTSASGTAIELQRGGLPEYATMIVECKVASDDATAKPFMFSLELSVDNGSNYIKVAMLQNDLDAVGSFRVPVGFYDVIPEAFAAGNVQVRCTVTWDSGSGTSDPEVMVWLAHRGA